MIPNDVMNLKSIWEVITKGNAFNVAQIVAFIKDNIGTLTSVSRTHFIVFVNSEGGYVVWLYPFI